MTPLLVVCVAVAGIVAGMLIGHRLADREPDTVGHWKVIAQRWEIIAAANRRDLAAVATDRNRWRTKAHQLAARVAREPAPLAPKSAVDPMSLPPQRSQENR